MDYYTHAMKWIQRNKNATTGLDNKSTEVTVVQPSTGPAASHGCHDTGRSFRSVLCFVTKMLWGQSP